MALCIHRRLLRGSIDRRHWRLHPPLARGAAAEVSPVLPKELARSVTDALDKAERAATKWTVVATDFVKPPVEFEVQRILDKRADVKCVAWGGHASAERSRLIFGPEEMMYEATHDPAALGLIAAVQIQGSYLFKQPSHRDFLGTIMSLGIARDAVGDILVHGEKPAQALVVPEIVELLEAELVQVQNVKVETSRMDLDDVDSPVLKLKKMITVEKSCRLDAVASTGFKTTRDVVKDSVKSGKVRVNWIPVKKHTTEVKEGDMISIDNFGRLRVDVVVPTVKGKFSMELLRYI